MSCTVLISEFAAPSRPISCSSFHKQDQPQTSLQLPLQQGACNEQGSEERQQDAHRLASCMSDHPHPYVWNSASQRYEPRTSSYAADSQQQQQQECQQQQQPHSGYRVASPPSRVLNDYRPQPPLDDWNPWAYLDSSSQRPYTPSQPAVGADLPSQYDPYRLPSIQQQGLADAYDPHNYQAPGSGSSYSASVRRAAATTHQGQLPYLQENYSSSHYHGWTPEASRGSFAEAYPETFILPPLNRQYPATAVNPTSTSQTQQLTYQPNDRALPLDLQAPRPSRHDPSSLSATGLPSYHDFSSKTPRTASSEATDYFPSAIRQRSLSDPALTWEEFQSHWKGYISSAESLLREQAKRGELAGFIYHNMAQPLPTLDSCDDLVRGLTDSYRFTVDRLKQLIRGIQLVPGLPYPHPKVSGTKQELINRLIDLLRSLKAADSPAYYNVAKLIGEAQGITYVSTDASGTTSSSAPQAGSSAPHNSYGWQSGYSAPAPSLPSDYAVRPSQFGLLRSPSRTGSSSASVYGAPAAGSAPNGNLSASYTQHNRLYSNSPNTHYRPLGASANGTSVGPSPASSHALPSRPGMSTSYGNSLSNQIPTSLPVPLPPKSAIAGQPAIPMNFKPSPFFNVISAVSTVTTLPRSHPNERATGTAYVHLTEDQRQKLLTAREDPKAPQYQLRLYCTSGDFYNPHTTPYGAAGRQALPIEFPLSSEAKMNDVAVIANLRGIKKKPGTAPPAHVSNAKVGNPSRTSNSSNNPNINGPIGSFALKLNNIRESNKVELVYMNTEKSYYMIVYFVEAFSVEQVVEKIKKERFRQKEDVLKSIHRAAEDPDIQATASTISMKDPLTYTTLNTPIRSINCPHLQCFDAFCFLSMMENTPDWKCPICNRAILSNINELVHDGFFQDIKNQLSSSSSSSSNIDTVIIEIDGTWRTEDYKFGNSKKALEFQEKLRNGTMTSNGVITSGLNSSRASSIALGKDGTPSDIKPDVFGGDGGGRNTSLAIPNGSSRGHSKSKTPAAIIELDDDDDDDDHPYGNDDTPPPPSRSQQMNGITSRPSQQASGRTAGKVIDLTLDSDDDDDDGASSSIVGLGSRAPSIRTPGGGAGAGAGASGRSNTTASLSIPLTASRTPTSGSGAGSSATTIHSSATTVNGNAAAAAVGGTGNTTQTAGVKRRYDSEALYDDLWNNEETNASIRDANNNNNNNNSQGDGERPSQVPRYS